MSDALPPYTVSVRPCIIHTGRFRWDIIYLGTTILSSPDVILRGVRRRQSPTRRRTDPQPMTAVGTELPFAAVQRYGRFWGTAESGDVCQYIGMPRTTRTALC
jgi:hypothetical protein